MKTHTRFYKKKNIQEILSFAKNEFEGNFLMKVTNYTCSIKNGKDRIFFGGEPTDTRAFRYFNKMNKEIGGELRDTPEKIKYHDFTGISQNEKIEDLYCVDINSAYLSVLKNEKVISEETYQYINSTSRKNKKSKLARLKSVGMFAKHPLEITYKNSEIEKYTNERSPFAWVFFLACQKTGEAMEIVKKEIAEDYLFFWVDGIFTRKNPEKIVEILKTLGFNSKIEIITNLKKSEKNIVYYKEGKQKLLFLPNNYSGEKREIEMNIENYTTI